jgi:hypothetical protein
MQDYNIHYVRALVEADWHEIPVPVARPVDPDPHAPEPPKLVRTVVLALEDGLWGVNGVPVNVFPALAVSFNSSADANHFFGYADRACRLHVVPGQLVQFYDERDADHFVAIGQAERIHHKAARRELAAKAEQPANVVGLKRAAR